MGTVLRGDTGDVTDLGSAGNIASRADGCGLVLPPPLVVVVAVEFEVDAVVACNGVDDGGEDDGCEPEDAVLRKGWLKSSGRDGCGCGTSFGDGEPSSLTVRGSGCRLPRCTRWYTPVGLTVSGVVTFTRPDDTSNTTEAAEVSEVAEIAGWPSSYTMLRRRSGVTGDCCRDSVSALRWKRSTWTRGVGNEC